MVITGFLQQVILLAVVSRTDLRLANEVGSAWSTSPVPSQDPLILHNQTESSNNNIVVGLT